MEIIVAILAVCAVFVIVYMLLYCIEVGRRCDKQASEFVEFLKRREVERDITIEQLLTDRISDSDREKIMLSLTDRADRPDRIERKSDVFLRMRGHG